MNDLTWLEENTAGYELVKSSHEPTIKYRLKCWYSNGSTIFSRTEWGYTIEDAVRYQQLWFGSNKQHKTSLS